MKSPSLLLHFLGETRKLLDECIFKLCDLEPTYFIYKFRFLEFNTTGYKKVKMTGTTGGLIAK